jgi:dolichol-phosphate mannosyltransferase
MTRDISVIVPALDEEENILSTLKNLLMCFKEFNLDGEIIVVNDGSIDSTGSLAKRIQGIKLIEHEKPLGIGISFWDGLKQAEGRVVTMIPGDNENDPGEILRYYDLTKQVDLVVPFLINKKDRPLFRRFVSYLFCLMIKITFRVDFRYTNGTSLINRTALEKTSHKSKGFFFQAEMLVKLVKKGYLFAEVPYRVGKRKAGASKSITFDSLKDCLKDYFQLIKDI